MAEDTVKIEITIEPSWISQPYITVIEVPAADLAGLEGPARDNKIIDIAQDEVSNVCSWGAREVTGDA